MPIPSGQFFHQDIPQAPMFGQAPAQPATPASAAPITALLQLLATPQPTSQPMAQRPQQGGLANLLAAKGNQGQRPPQQDM